MALGMWLLLAVVLLQPPASVTGLVAWTRRLRGSVGVPRFAVRVAYALAALAGVTIATGLVLGVVSAVGGVRDESAATSDRARHLAEGISEILNGSVFGLLPAGIGAAWILFWRGRMRREPGRSAS
jgi:hypothetical protein